MTSSKLKNAARNALKENFLRKLLLLIVPLLLSITNNRITSSYSSNVNIDYKDALPDVSTTTDSLSSIDWGAILAIVIPVVAVILLINFVISIIVTIFQTAAMFNYLEIFRGEKEEINLIKDIFRAFKEGSFWKITWLTCLISVIMVVLFFIPIIGWAMMIYYGLSWSQATYVLHDKIKNDDYQGLWDVLNTSKHMMKGYKFKYFLFNLTFIGWYLLNGITFGLANIWTMPYITMSMVAFYEARVQDRL